MPFGLKLRRTGRYILSHKNSFLVHVQLLDNNVMDCTLTVESTGIDCLNAVATKLDLKEVQYFGLRYINKQMAERWVELDKPLKKQIDRNAHDPTLYFGVTYYVANIEILKDEITRYLFYLQLKNNLIDGRIPCTAQEAIELASYILQAEFGDHDPETHTVQYFKDFILFSEAIAPTHEIADSLMEDTLSFHQCYRSMTATDAEYKYIQKVMHLEGYDRVFTGVKNEHSNNSKPVQFPINARQQQNEVLSSQENLHPHAMEQRSEYGKSQTSLNHLHLSQTSLNQSRNYQQDYGLASGFTRDGSMYSSPSVGSLSHSKSFQNRSPGSSNIASTHYLACNEVPVYRYTPDYEQAVRQRRRYSSYLENQVNVQQQRNNNVSAFSNQPMKPRPHSMIYSPHELLQHAIQGPLYAQYPPQDWPNQMIANIPFPASGALIHSGLSQDQLPAPSQNGPTHLEQKQSLEMLHMLQGNVHKNAILAASTPELANPMQQVRNYSASEMQLYRHYTKPPPPYTHNNSTSTPDLSNARHNAVSASSPELHQAIATNQNRHTHPVHAVHAALAEDGYEIPAVNSEENRVYQHSFPNPQHAQLKQPSPRSRQQGRHHRPISYPPRLDHDWNAIHGMSERDLMLFRNENQIAEHQKQDLANEQSLINSSSSSVDSSFENQMYLHQQQHQYDNRQKISPVPNPVMMKQNAQASDGNMQYMDFNPNQYQWNHPGVNKVFLPPENQQENEECHPRDSYGLDYAFDEQNSDDEDMAAAAQHSKMPSNATMLIHSSASEPDSDNDGSDKTVETNKTDFRQMSFTTIDHWLRKKPAEMYVPPKQKQPKHYEEQDEIEALGALKIGTVEMEDHDPPRSYYKPLQMDSYDEGDPSKVSVFPHPNPSNRQELNETNPFYKNSLNTNNPFGISGQLDSNPFDYEVPNILQEEDVTVEEDSKSDFLISQINNDDTLDDGPQQSLHSDCGLIYPQIPSVSTDEWVVQLEKQVEDGRVLTEFRKIPHKRKTEPVSGDPIGLRDRVKSIVPYLYNKVTLPVSTNNPDGYINASLVEMKVGDHHLDYVICQSPMNDYMSEFWEMIWLQRVDVIAMVSKVVEDGKIKCARYWPELQGHENSMLFEKYIVTCEINNSSFQDKPFSSSVCKQLLISCLNVQRIGSTECRKVWHLQYVGWPDTGAPDDAGDFLAFMEEMASVRRLTDESKAGNEVSVVLIHCASGAGRSGVVVLCDLMKNSLEHNKATTVPQMLEILRNQRMDAVQTVSQYNFVYQVLILFLRNSRLI